ncbi:MAG: outer membrane beta-barrel protein [Bacteroidaceae bacterium]|nr:outer membrane beta-barrel protein [Bacteroidaceae bacterium]
MKKILFTFVFMATAIVASAQIYVGGNIGCWNNNNSDTKTFKFAPEFGYNLNDKISIGGTAEYSFSDYGSKMHGFGVNPYARYTIYKAGIVSLFADACMNFTYYKVQDGDSGTTFGLGVKPGISIAINKNFSIVTHLGFLGYRNADEDIPEEVLPVEPGFGFDINGNTLEFGIYYSL